MIWPTLDDNFEWDIFLSYHSEIEQFVASAIKQYLESRGYRVCWHHQHFVPGRPIVDNIQHCVDNSRKVVFVISNNFANSSHCMTELQYTLYRLEQTRTRCLIPILLDCHVPEVLKSLVTYWPVIDTSNTDSFQGQLIKYIGKQAIERNLLILMPFIYRKIYHYKCIIIIILTNFTMKN